MYIRRAFAVIYARAIYLVRKKRTRETSRQHARLLLLCWTKREVSAKCAFFYIFFFTKHKPFHSLRGRISRNKFLRRSSEKFLNDYPER